MFVNNSKKKTGKFKKKLLGTNLPPPLIGKHLVIMLCISQLGKVSFGALANPLALVTVQHEDTSGEQKRLTFMSR